MRRNYFSIMNFFFIVNRSAASTPPYPVLPNSMTASTDSLRQQQQKRVKVIHAYDAQHDDELTIRPGKH
jgi:hypothetical protein